MPPFMAMASSSTVDRISFLHRQERITTLILWNTATIFILTILWKTVGLKNMRTGDDKPPRQTWLNAFYNALSTQFAFAGVGDWTPANNAGRVLLTCNILTGLMNIFWIIG